VRPVAWRRPGDTSMRLSPWGRTGKEGRRWGYDSGAEGGIGEASGVEAARRCIDGAMAVWTVGQKWKPSMLGEISY